MANDSDFFDDLNIWGKRIEGLPTRFDINRDISPVELAHLYQKYAYLYLVNPEAGDDFPGIRFVRAKSGWLILDYENALSSSPGEMLLSNAAYRTDESGKEQRVVTGTGTEVKQIVDTAGEMVHLIKEKEKPWPAMGIHGHPLMCWGAWIAAQDLQIPLTGYTPSSYEIAKYERIASRCPALLMQVTPGVKP